jgi:hypothetical protein
MATVRLGLRVRTLLNHSSNAFPFQLKKQFRVQAEGGRGWSVVKINQRCERQILQRQAYDNRGAGVKLPEPQRYRELS